MQIISSKITDIAKCIDLSHQVREEVFQKGQGIAREIDFDENDNDCIQIVAMEDKEPIGTVRLRKIEENVSKVERLAVLVDFRKNGVGKEIMLEAVKIAKSENIKKLVLNSQMSAKVFYDKLGFIPEGEVFEEVGIPHIKMSLTI